MRPNRSGWSSAAGRAAFALPRSGAGFQVIALCVAVQRMCGMGQSGKVSGNLRYNLVTGDNSLKGGGALPPTKV